MPYLTSVNPRAARIATMNIWNTDIQLHPRYDAFMHHVNAVAPDVLCLQEVGEHTQSWVTRLPNDTALEHIHIGERLAIASRTRIFNPGVIPLPTPTPVPSRDGIQTGSAITGLVTTRSGHPAHIIAAHLAWGAEYEPDRLAQLTAIEAWATKNVGPVGTHGNTRVFLGADLNTTPGTVTARWLRGDALNRDGHGTLWTDGWEHARYTESPTHGATSTPANQFAADTAAMVGITRPEYLAARRIDYIFTRGYAHGVPGTPLRAGTWGHTTDTIYPPPSDHYGVWVDTLDE